MKKDSILKTAWKILYPIGIHYGIQIFVMAIGTVVLMNLVSPGDAAQMEAQLNDLTEEYTVLFLFFSSLFTIPIMRSIYKKSQRKNRSIIKSAEMKGKDIAAIMVTAFFLAYLVNLVISISPLPKWFPYYEEETAVTLYSGGVLLQILTLAGVVCIAEELLMRGAIYETLYGRWGRKAAFFGSALLFGVFHLNMVQGVYAGILGLYLAWVRERYRNLWAPIFAHMAANLLGILLSLDTGFENLIFGSVSGFLIFTLSGIAVVYGLIQWMKNTNPSQELEFVKKEPDTLEKLTEEYKKEK